MFRLVAATILQIAAARPARSLTRIKAFDCEPATNDNMAQELQGKFYRPERTLAFSDGVIAVAITLLVLDLKLPALGQHASDASLVAALVEALPKIGMYALSFAVVSRIWIGHHRKFACIRRVDPRLIGINFVFLMLVGLVPFVTGTLGDHLNAVATILYAAVLALTSLLSVSMWWYAKRTPGLLEEGIPRPIEREVVLSPLLNASVFAASIPIALLSPSAGRLTWLLLIPAAICAGAGTRSPG
jgi:uncharacterized membrane protein